MHIKHVVLMVSYNQEKYITTALDSILKNDVLPDKIIINDDCSTDNTWNIIQDYVKQYPELIIANHNEHNLGIFKNINKTWMDGINSGCDVISWCSGDDLWEKNVIKNLNNSIEKNNIDIKNDKFIIVTNSYLLNKNGKKQLWNNYKLKNSDIALARLGKKLNHREIGISINVLKNDFTPLDASLGLASDTVFVYSLERKIDKWFFENFEAANYRTRVGVVSREKVSTLLKSEANAYKYILDNFSLNRYQKLITEFWISFDTYLTEITINNWIKYLIAYFKNLFIQPKFLNTKNFICLQPPVILKLLMYIKNIQKRKAMKS